MDHDAGGWVFGKTTSPPLLPVFMWPFNCCEIAVQLGLFQRELLHMWLKIRCMCRRKQVQNLPTPPS